MSFSTQVSLSLSSFHHARNKLNGIIFMLLGGQNNGTNPLQLDHLIHSPASISAPGKIRIIYLRNAYKIKALTM